MVNVFWSGLRLRRFQAMEEYLWMEQKWQWKRREAQQNGVRLLWSGASLHRLSPLPLLLISFLHWQDLSAGLPFGKVWALSWFSSRLKKMEKWKKELASSEHYRLGCCQFGWNGCQASCFWLKRRQLLACMWRMWVGKLSPLSSQNQQWGNDENEKWWLKWVYSSLHRFPPLLLTGLSSEVVVNISGLGEPALSLLTASERNLCRLSFNSCWQVVQL